MKMEGLQNHQTKLTSQKRPSLMEMTVTGQQRRKFSCLKIQPKGFLSETMLYAIMTRKWQLYQKDFYDDDVDDKKKKTHKQQ